MELQYGPVASFVAFSLAPFSSSRSSSPRHVSHQIGSSAHTDWGFLTLVVQFSKGLECFVDDNWMPIDPVDGGIVVNCGDYISLFSRGRIKSPLHRVVNGSTDRYSLVFFYYPSFDSKVPMMQSNSDSSLSLLKDQHASAMTEPTSAVTALDSSAPFGEYIMGKWASVSRA